MDRPTSDVLRAFGLAGAEPIALAGRLSNAVWRVDDPRGSFVLRRHDPALQPLAHVCSELVWLDALGRGGRPFTPRPLRQANGGLAPVVEPDRDGTPGALWTMLDWVEGETLGRLPDADEAALIGTMLAELDRRTRPWSPPTWFARPAYDAAHFAAAAHILLGRVGECPDADARCRLDAGLRSATDALTDLARDPAAVGLIHADVHDGNVVYAGAPKRTGLIDFGRCGVGCWALDLAMAMHYLPEALHPPLVAAYDARFGLTSQSRRALPHLRYLAAIDNLATLSAVPDEIPFVLADLPGLTTQAETLVG